MARKRQQTATEGRHAIDQMLRTLRSKMMRVSRDFTPEVETLIGHLRRVKLLTRERKEREAQKELTAARTAFAKIVAELAQLMGRTGRAQKIRMLAGLLIDQSSDQERRIHQPQPTAAFIEAAGTLGVL